MRTFVRCGQLFSGREDDARKGETLVFDQQGVIEYAGPEAASPRRARSDQVLDYSGCFVMPGPIDFRTLRGMFFAQKVAAAGFTAICSPGDAGQISLSIRNAIRAGLFDGPRVMAAGRYVTTHQGLTDFFFNETATTET